MYRAFFRRCLACPHYNDGRCRKYNDIMDRAVEEGILPQCNGIPYPKPKKKRPYDDIVADIEAGYVTEVDIM